MYSSFTRCSSLILSLLIVLVALPSGVIAKNRDREVIVFYKGKRVSYTELEAHGPKHCHDLVGQSQLTCFDTPQEVEEDVKAKERTTSTNEVAVTTASSYYVVFTDDRGGSITLQYNYPWLGTINWDNRATYLRTYINTGRTVIWNDANYNGQVGYMEGTYNPLPSVFYKQVSAVCREAECPK